MFTSSSTMEGMVLFVLASRENCTSLIREQRQAIQRFTTLDHEEEELGSFFETLSQDRDLALCIMEDIVTDPLAFYIPPVEVQNLLQVSSTHTSPHRDPESEDGTNHAEQILSPSLDISSPAHETNPSD